MSVLDFLRQRAVPRRDEAETSSTSVRRIVAELEAMDGEQARYLAAFAYVLGRVAHADLAISNEETAAMEEIVRRLGGLSEEQAVLVVQIAKSQNRLLGGTENFLVTREFRDIASAAQRAELLDCLFAVSAADESISGAEERQIRQIASELGFSHREFVEAMSRYSEHRAVLKSLDP
jgi:uncharacterized tellurite resistance protein B-like protein